MQKEDSAGRERQGRQGLREPEPEAEQERQREQKQAKRIQWQREASGQEHSSVCGNIAGRCTNGLHTLSTRG